MSSILLSNPFVTPAPPPQAPGGEAQTALAIAPSQGASNSGAAGDPSAFSGNGSGFGNSSGAQAIIAKAQMTGALDRPFEATPGSVVNAQAQDGANPLAGSNLPKVEMPDPLPTSPFLKRS